MLLHYPVKIKPLNPILQQDISTEIASNISNSFIEMDHGLVHYINQSINQSINLFDTHKTKKQQ